MGDRTFVVVKGVLVVVAFGLYWLLTTLSNRWVKRERRTLREASGHEPRKGEEDSLGAWLKVPSPVLDDLNKQLQGNPFPQFEDVAADGLPTPSKTPDSKPPLEDDRKE